MKRVLVGGLLLASLLPLQASAEEFSPMRSEVSFAGNITSTSGGGQSTTSTFLFGSYGYYFTPQVVGTINVMTFTSSTGGNTTGMVDVGVGAKYYFSVGKKGDFVPWVEGDVGAASISSAGAFGTTTSSGTLISAAVGGTYWVTEGAGAFVDARLRSTSVSGGGVTYTSSDTILEFGATFKF